MRARVDHGFDQSLSAAGNNEIDVAIHFRHQPHGFAIGARNEQDAVGRQTGSGAALLERLGDRDVGMDRLRTAAQDGGVTCLGAKHRGIARHVGARLVDDPDDADRNSHFCNPKSVNATSILG